MWSSLTNRRSLPLISTVAPHLAFVSVQQISQHMLVGYRSCRRTYRVHDAGLRVHTDVRLHAEVPLVALARLMHLRIALPLRVLRRRGRMNNGGVHNRSGRDADAPAVQITVHRIQHGPAQIVLLQQVTKLQDGGLIRCWSLPQSTPANRRSTGESYSASSA